MSDRPVTITVTGHAERDVAPDRCTVALRVHADGPTREQAADPVTSAVATVTDLVTELTAHPDSPVTRWAFDRVQHGRYRPYDSGGKQRPWRYTSTASITVVFHRFDAIAAFVDEVAGCDAVTVTDLHWWISRKRRERRLAAVRDLAVQNALDKAKGYTKSLGYKSFRAVAIADPGMLGMPPSPGPAPLLRSAVHAGAAPVPGSGDEGPAMTLEPDRITLTADVEARFEASTDS